MNQKPPIPAPGHLSEPSRQFWGKVQDEYDIRDEAGLRLLQAACEQLDVAESARLEVAESGSYYTDRLQNRRPNPALAAMRNAHVTFSRLTRTLGIDIPAGEKSK